MGGTLSYQPIGVKAPGVPVAQLVRFGKWEELQANEHHDEARFLSHGMKWNRIHVLKFEWCLYIPRGREKEIQSTKIGLLASPQALNLKGIGSTCIGKQLTFVLVCHGPAGRKTILESRLDFCSRAARRPDVARRI